jgi:hypothetical protein
MVIAYLVVTSLINLSLGYALAGYLRRDADRRRVGAPQGPAARTVATNSQLGANESRVAVERAMGPAAPVGEQMADEADVASGIPDGAIEARTQEMEQDLLAGIEEFRNQLAQLRSIETLATSYSEPALVE